MVLSTRWLALAVVAGTAIALSWYRRRDYGRLVENVRRDYGRLVENVRRYSAPTAAFYDASTSPLISGFFTRVAQDLAVLAPRASVLEVGSGPGRLAAKLAALAPEVRVTGVDVAPDMVERANALAARSGVAGRVAFRVGDVAALPFPDGSFDIVVSTFSLHHWPDPARGLAEIYRVLRPGGVARVYDLADWLRRLEHGGAGMAGIPELVRDSPFGAHGAWTQSIAARLGPIPLAYGAELRREQLSATSEGK